MPLLQATVFIAFVVLGIACLAVFGLFGIVIWLLIYGLFHALARTLKRHIGDSGDISHLEHRATHRRAPSERDPSASTQRRPPSPAARPS